MIRPDIETLKNGTPIVQNDDWTITAPASPPEIFDWIEHLEAENATLKAYNRQLVDALEKISNIKIDIAILTSPWSGESETLEVRTEAATLAEQALQTPPDKLALAEAEVLRAAEGLVRKVEAYYVDDDTICEITSDLDYAVEAVKEAKREIVPEPASFSEDAKEKFYPHLDSYHLQKAQEENQQ